MAYQADSLALARAASRMNFTRGNILPPRWTPNPIEDTTPETLDAIRRSLAAAQTYRDPLEDPSFAAARRARLATPSAVPSEIPRKPFPTEFRGQHKTYNFAITAPLGIGNSGEMTTELFSLPAIVRRILITHDATDDYQLELIVTTSQNVGPSDAEVLGSPIIYPNPNSGLGNANNYAVAAGAPFPIPLDHIIQTVPWRLVAWIRNVTAGPHRAYVHVTVQDLDPEDLRVITVPVILQQQVLTRSITSPAPPAPQGQAPPRGLTLSVWQSGRKLYSRDVPWACVDPVMKVEFMTALFNNKMPLGMEPIW